MLLNHSLSIPVTALIPKSYYRSKLFIASSESNPMIAAAGPIFSLLERLAISPNLPPINEIRDNIEHEMNAFTCRLLGQKYTEETTVIASYLLSATIDELLGKNYIRVYDTPAEFKAFTPSSHHEQGPQSRFFDIIDYIKTQANQYLELIELSYYCLITGFEGKYHLRADGRQALENLIEELYQLVQKNRVNKPLKLFKEHTEHVTQINNQKPLITTVLIAVGLLCSMYFASHLVLEQKAKTVLLGHTVLAQMDHE